MSRAKITLIELHKWAARAEEGFSVVLPSYLTAQVSSKHSHPKRYPMQRRQRRMKSNLRPAELFEQRRHFGLCWTTDGLKLRCDLTALNCRQKSILQNQNAEPPKRRNEMAAQPPKKKSPLLPMAAGCIAGAIEATCVWPMEFIKVSRHIAGFGTRCVVLMESRYVSARGSTIGTSLVGTLMKGYLNLL